MRERVGTDPSDEVVRYVYGPALERQRRSDLPYLVDASRAHVVMLVRQGIIAADVGKRILSALDSLAEAGGDLIAWNPALEDIYLNVEAWLIAELGPSVGGRLHTARSRNDLQATVHRMRTRAALIDLGDRLTALRESLLDVAARNVETLLVGYTHQQPAQPITFGHYLLAIDQSLERSEARLARAFESTNQSPLGACALAGTTYPIDRQLLAELLGFDSVLANTVDAVGMREYVADTLYATAMIGTTLNRMATDFQLWCTFEYGYAELADASSGVSSVMPQKKNPIVLEHVKGKAAHLTAALTDTLVAWKGVPYTHSREISVESTHAFEDAVEEAKAVLALGRCAVEGITIRPERVTEILDQSGALATEVADALVQEAGVPFRTAHEVVAGAVRRVSSQPDRSGVARLVEAVITDAHAAGYGVPERLGELVTPLTAVRRRGHLGGPAPEQTAAVVDSQQRRLASDAAAWKTRRVGLEATSARLPTEAARIVR